MSALKGTIVTGPVVPGDTNDTYASGVANYIQGGHHQKATLAERDAITAERRAEGMLCTVAETGRTYRLTGSAWVDTRSETDASVSALSVRADTAAADITVIKQAQANGFKGYATLAALAADLSPADGAMAQVTNDALPANNGAYRKSGATGTGGWVKSANDIYSDVGGLKTLTVQFTRQDPPLVLADGRIILWALTDDAGRIAAALTSSGEWLSLHGHSSATSSQDGFMSASDKSWRDSMPFQVVRDFYVDGLAYLMAVTDSAGRVAWGITADGAVRSAKSVITELVTIPVFASMAADEITSKQIHFGTTNMVLATDRPGWLFTFEDGNRRIAFGLKDDGTLVAPGLFIPGITPGTITTGMLADALITASKLDLTLRRKTGTDLIPTRPDDLRPQLAAIGLRGTQSWQQLPHHVTPVVYGKNTTGVTLEFRQASGLLIRGERLVGSYDPGAVGSVIFRGQITNSSTWPPVLTPAAAAGDYLTYVVTATRVIGGSTLNSGDCMVYNGSAWVYQASPGTGGARYERDWWRASAAGTFGGVALGAGDILVYLGTASTPSNGDTLTTGSGRSSWRRGRPDRGEFFRCGTFNPSGGLPSSPADGDLWEVSASGSAGGLTLAANDAIFRDSGVWCQIPTTTIKSVPAGAGVHMRCINSSSEWEMRTPAGLPVPQVSVSLKARGLRMKWLSSQDIACRGDSMTAAIGRTLAPLVAPRAVDNQSYGGCTSRGIFGQAENLIDLGDPDFGKVVVSVQGQNNIGDLPQVQEMAEKFAQITGTAGGRIVHVSVLGSRVFTWNGTRLVCDGFESQMPGVVDTSANAYAAAKRYFRDSWPDQYIDFWAALREAAMLDNEVSLEFPGKTIAQVATDYGILPLKFFQGVDWTGIIPADLVYRGTWATAGLPAGGAANDYYIRTASGQIGALLVNVAGTWRELTFDFLHVTDAASAFVAAKIKAFLDAKNW